MKLEMWYTHIYFLDKSGDDLETFCTLKVNLSSTFLARYPVLT